MTPADVWVVAAVLLAGLGLTGVLAALAQQRRPWVAGAMLVLALVAAVLALGADRAAFTPERAALSFLRVIAEAVN
jgi:hypothetical protein